MNNFSKFQWIKDFVFSNELEQEVALAGLDNKIVLIDVFGYVLEDVSNE
jgi:hypothetical protein